MNIKINSDEIIKEMYYLIDKELSVDNITDEQKESSMFFAAKTFLKEKNNEWLSKLKDSLDINSDNLTENVCAEYLRILFEISKRIALETRDERRKHLLNITKNYFKILKYLSFDKQIMFLDILDNLSDVELDYLLVFYNKKIERDANSFTEEQYTIQEKLAGVGLMTKEIKNLQSAFKVMNIEIKTNFENIVKEINKMRNSTESYYDLKYEERFNPYRDSPEPVFSQSLLGLEFVSFIIGDISVFNNPNEKRIQRIKENISNAVQRFKR